MLVSFSSVSSVPSIFFSFLPFFPFSSFFPLHFQKKRTNGETPLARPLLRNPAKAFLASYARKSNEKTAHNATFTLKMDHLYPKNLVGLFFTFYLARQPYEVKLTLEMSMLCLFLKGIFGGSLKLTLRNQNNPQGLK